MKGKKHLVIGLIGGLLVGLQVSAQPDMHFSQFSFSPSTLNPATTGAIDGLWRVNLNYKDQWRNISAPFTTFGGSFDMPFLRYKISDGALAFGVAFFNDKAGDLDYATNSFTLSLAANKSIDKRNNFSLGLSGGFGSRGLSTDADKQEWDSQYQQGSGYNGNLSSQESSKVENFVYGDFNAGLLWRYEKEKFEFHTGFSVFHINSPKLTFYKSSEKLDPRLVFHGGSQIGLKGKAIYFLPQYLFMMQGNQMENNAGLLVKYLLREGSRYTGNVEEVAVYIGGWYRFGDAAIANVRLDFKSFSVGVSYDFNLSNLKAASDGRGGVEFSLSYIQQLPPAVRTKRRSLM